MAFHGCLRHRTVKIIRFLLRLQNHDIARQTNDSKYIDLAFQYSESNKAVVLFEAIKANAKSSFNGVPQTLIDQETAAIKNMAIYENQLYKDAKNENLWRKKLIDVTDELAKLKAKFKKNYPQYYNFKYSRCVNN